MAKILLVEDDQAVAEAIVDALEFESNVVEHVDCGLEASQRLKLYQYDLVVLDWDLPRKSGVEVCGEYRSGGGTLPILMLTGKSSVEDRVTGLDAGADDYLPKPFSMKELSARVRALLRRPEPMVSELVQLGPLQIDLKFHKVMRGQEELNLLAKEISLLEFLVRHRGQVFSVDDLLNKVWHSESDSSEDAVRQCVTRLRKKIDGEGENSLIVTVKGLGYKVV